MFAVYLNQIQPLLHEVPNKQTSSPPPSQAHPERGGALQVELKNSSQIFLDEEGNL